MELRLKLKGFVIWTSIMIVFILVFLALFPTYKTMFVDMTLSFDSFPPELLAALGMTAVDFTKVLEYYAYCHQYVLMAGAVYAFVLGAKILAVEESEKTIEFLYAKPVSRSRIYIEKMVAIQTLFFVFTLIQAIITAVFCILYKEPSNTTTQVALDITRIYVSYLLIGYLFMGLGMLISSIVRSSSKAGALALGIFFILYFLGMFSNMFESLSFLRYIAPLEYLRPRDMINGGRVDFVFFFISASLVGIFYSFGYLLYNNKDLKI